MQVDVYKIIDLRQDAFIRVPQSREYGFVFLHLLATFIRDADLHRKMQMHNIPHQGDDHMGDAIWGCHSRLMSLPQFFLGEFHVVIKQRPSVSSTSCQKPKNSPAEIRLVLTISMTQDGKLREWPNDSTGR